MLSYGIGDAYFMQKIAELMYAGYEISDWFADLRRYLRKLVMKAVFLENYEWMSLHSHTAWVHSSCPEKDALSIDVNSTHEDSLSSSTISDRDRNEEDEGVGRYI